MKNKKQLYILIPIQWDSGHGKGKTRSIERTIGSERPIVLKVVILVKANN